MSVKDSTSFRYNTSFDNNLVLPITNELKRAIAIDAIIINCFIIKEAISQFKKTLFCSSQNYASQIVRFLLVRDYSIQTTRWFI